jgi:uncharacterized protein YdhG (YjbR/CyaY superfamily)
MKFESIEKEAKVYPGEYVLHQPSQTIVLVGAFKRTEGTIRVLANGRLMEDKIENFKKIQLTRKEQKERKVSRCKGCKG